MLSRRMRLTADVAALVPPPRQVVANLPYNIATPLLIGWLRQAAALERLTLMFQQEVAERICCRSRHFSVWAAVYTGAVDLRGGSAAAFAACGFCAATQGVFRGCGLQAICGAAGTSAVRGNGAADRQRPLASGAKCYARH